MRTDKHTLIKRDTHPSGYTDQGRPITDRDAPLAFPLTHRRGPRKRKASRNEGRPAKCTDDV